MYLKLTCIEKIDSNKPDELFTGSDANGIIIAIKQIHLYDSNGVEQRIVRMTKELIETLKQTKIQL